MAEFRKLQNYSNYRIYPDGRIYSEFINKFINPTFDSSKILYNKLITVGVDNTVLNSRVKVLESV